MIIDWLSFLRAGDDLRRVLNLSGFVGLPMGGGLGAGGPTQGQGPALTQHARSAPSAWVRAAPSARPAARSPGARPAGGRAGRAGDARGSSPLGPGPLLLTRARGRLATGLHRASERSARSSSCASRPQVEAARRHGPCSGIGGQLLAQRLRGLHHLPRPALHPRVCEWFARRRRGGAGWAVRTKSASRAVPGAVGQRGPRAEGLRRKTDDNAGHARQDLGRKPSARPGSGTGRGPGPPAARVPKLRPDPLRSRHRAKLCLESDVRAGMPRFSRVRAWAGL